MSQVIVMVAFHSLSSATEKLATAVAVGAVQSRAAIRMRRMPDPDTAAVIQKFPEFESELERMNAHYVRPTENHVLEADVLVFGVPAEFTASSLEWSGYLKLLGKMGAEGKLEGKVGVALGSEPGLTAFSKAIAPLGLKAGGRNASPIEAIPSDGIGTAIELGHHIVEVARSQKRTDD